LRFFCNKHIGAVKVKVKVTLRPPVSLGVRRPSGTRDQFYFLLEIFFRQLRFCNFVAASLTRGRVCNLVVQLLLDLARAVTLGSKSRRPHGHILLSLTRLPQPVKVKVKVTLRLTVSQYVLVSSPNLGHLTRFFFLFFLKVTVLSFWGALSDERSGLSCVSLCH
jgi:hypothetical protein